MNNHQEVWKEYKTILNKQYTGKTYDYNYTTKSCGH